MLVYLIQQGRVVELDESRSLKFVFPDQLKVALVHLKCFLLLPSLLVYFDDLLEQLVDVLEAIPVLYSLVMQLL